MRDAPIPPVRVNLVALQLGALLCRSIDDDAAGAVDLAGHQKRALAAVAEQLDQHLDDVIIRVVIVIQQDDVIARNRDYPRALPNMRPAFSNRNDDFGHKTKLFAMTNDRLQIYSRFCVMENTKRFWKFQRENAGFAKRRE